MHACREPQLRGTSILERPVGLVCAAMSGAAAVRCGNAVIAMRGGEVAGLGIATYGVLGDRAAVVDWAHP